MDAENRVDSTPNTYLKQKEPQEKRLTTIFCFSLMPNLKSPPRHQFYRQLLYNMYGGEKRDGYTKRGGLIHPLYQGFAALTQQVMMNL